MKQLFLHGLVAGILSGLAGFVYNMVYCKALLIDFSMVVAPLAIFGASLFGTVLASLGYFVMGKMIKNEKVADIIFNIIFIILSFASIIGVFTAKLPLEHEEPDLFFGLVMPMHFFPVLFWLACKPLFGRAAPAV